METRTNTAPALSTLRAHHTQILAMMADLGSPSQNREALVRELFVELRVHSILEQQLLFPAVSRSLSHDRTKAAGIEFYPMLALMLELEQMNFTGAQFEQTLADIEQRFVGHVTSQHCHLFPELSSSPAGVDLAALDHRIEERKIELNAMLTGHTAVCSATQSSPQHTRCA